MNDTQPNVTIHLHVDGSSFDVKVRLDQPISDLLDFIDTPEADFLHESSVLTPSFTFAFHKVKDGDDIYALRKRRIKSARIEPTTATEPTDAYSRFIQLRMMNSLGPFYEDDSFRFIIEQLYDPSLANEGARMRDRKLAVLERPNVYSSRTPSPVQKAPPRAPKNKSPTCISDGGTTPSQTALPPIWNVHPNFFDV